MKTSGYKPQHDIVFLLTTGEEFGYTNCYYDWCTGAWYAITHAHANWPGRLRAILNIEGMTRTGVPLVMRSNEELRPWVEKLAIVSDNEGLLPYSSQIQTPVWSWTDQWTFAAAGVPSIVFSTIDSWYTHNIYHTNFETQALIDWPYLGDAAKVIFRAEQGADSGLLPYSLTPRADSLAAAVSGSDLLAAGADPVAVARLTADVAHFKTAAAAYDTSIPTIAASRVRAANKTLLAVEKCINRNFTALNDGDFTIYPHQQVLVDVQGLNAALAALQASPVDASGALTALSGVAATWEGLYFSYQVFLKDMTRHAAGYYRLAWGGQGHLAKYLNVMPQYGQIEAGKFATALTGLTSLRKGEISDLNGRLAKMSCVLEKVTPQVQALP
jgi:hypothetical protein